MTDHGHCKTCKHWKRNRGFSAEYHGNHAGRCGSDRFVYGSFAPHDGLRYMDSEGYMANFDTGEDFGCVHWIARDETKGE